METKVKRNKVAHRFAFIQGLYFVLTGLWPTVHPNSFALVTDVQGPMWAFRAIGLLIFVVGLILLKAERQDQIDSSIALLAGASAFTLAVVDVDLLRLSAIGWLNVADVFIQLVFALAWCWLYKARI